MTPDLNETNRFLNILYGPNPLVCWQTFKNSPTCEAKPAWRYGTLLQQKQWLIDCNQQGLGIYFMVNEGDKQGRSAVNVKRVTAAFLDLDGAPLDPLLACSLQPAVITESSPNRYQAFWPISDCPLDKFTPLQLALAEKFGGDKAVIDLPRVMRVPGFFHLKKIPFQSRIHKVSDTSTVTYRELIGAAQLIIRPTQKPTNLFVPDDQPIPRGERHTTMVTVSSRLRNAGMSGKRLVDALMAENQSRCIPPLPEEEIVKISKWALKKDAVIVPPARSQTVKNIQTEVSLMTWKQLSQANLPNPKWIIPELLPEGLTILGGAPKVGKSWLVQHLCLAVATNSKALNNFITDQGQVLSLALEDTAQRFKSRMKVLNGGILGPDDAFFGNEFPTLPEAIGSIEEWIRSQDRPRLIVIDTLQKIRGKGFKNEGIYERDYADIASFQKLAGKYGVAIILVHHQRKAEAQDHYDKISGSVGITGAADTIWTLERKDRSKMHGVLEISGRDISDRKYQLVWQEKIGLWSFEGTPQEFAARGTQEKILNTMEALGVPTGPTELSNIIGVSKQAISKQIISMVSEGIVEKAAGQKDKYVLSPSWDAQGI